MQNQKKQSLNRINFLKEQINKWNEEYYQLSKPSVDDAIYDQAMLELKKLESENPEFITEDSPTQVVGFGKNSTFSHYKKVKHFNPMLSLDNAFDDNDLIEFEKRMANIVGKQNFQYTVEPKIDGLSISLHYRNGKLEKILTRGNGVEGEDVTDNKGKISNLPLTINYLKDIDVRGEIYIPIEIFEELNNKRASNNLPLFANPRNAASGSLRQFKNVNNEENRGLSLFAYSVTNLTNTEINYDFDTQEKVLKFLINNGFAVSENSRKLDSLEEVIQYKNKLLKIRYDLPYEIDGLVIKLNDIRLQKELGFTSKFPRWATAFKFPSEVKETTLLDIFPTVGRTGLITYNASLEPINIMGTLVKRATLHNSDYIKELDLRIGDRVLVKKAGDIIPKVISSTKNDNHHKLSKWTEAEYCPSCHTKLTRVEKEVDQYCLNKDCKAKNIQKLIHFASKKAMNIEGFAEKQIEYFYEIGLLKSFIDFYKLKNNKQHILSLEGYQIKSVEKLLESIERSKNRSFDKFIFALGIKHIGEIAAKDISQHFSNIEVLYEELLKDKEAIQHYVKDFGEVKAKELSNYIIENINWLKDLNKVLNLFSNKIENIIESQFTNKNVVVSGTIEGATREQVEDKLRKMGAIITKSVSSKTDFLILGTDGSNSKKNKLVNGKIINVTHIDEIK